MGDPEAQERLRIWRSRSQQPDPMTPTQEAIAPYLGDGRLDNETTLDWDYGINFTINTFHFICATLEYDEDLQNQYDNWIEENDLQEQYPIVTMERFVQEEYPEAGGIYGEGEPFLVNTYNHENCLDTVMQYYFWEDEGTEYVLVQFHLGGDVRGNYSDPVAFKLSENFELGFLDTSRGYIVCSNDECGVTVEWTHEGEDRSYFEPTRWYTDDCYHWYGERDQPQLNDLPTHQLSDDDLESYAPDFPEEHTIFVRSSEEAVCPICREGILQPVPYHT